MTYSSLFSFVVVQYSDKVATRGLVSLNRFEERLEVASSESIVVSALDHLKEKRGAVLKRFGEDLQEVTLVIVIDENSLTLDRVEVLLHLDINVSEAGSQIVVICVRDRLEENDAAGLHALHGVDDVLGAHRDMLNSRATIILAEFLDLALSHAGSRLINRHLDLLIEIGHYDRSQRGEVRVNHLVIDGPEAMEVKHLLVPLRCGFHLTVLLIADNMIDVQKLRHRHQTIQHFSLRVILESGQEGTAVG